MARLREIADYIDRHYRAFPHASAQRQSIAPIREAADALEAFTAEVIRRIAAAVAEEREACAVEAEFIANSLRLGAAASVMFDDIESLIRRDAGARVAGRVANVIRARAKKEGQ